MFIRVYYYKPFSSCGLHCLGEYFSELVGSQLPARMTHNAGLREGLVHKMVYILRLAAELRQRDKAADIAVEPYELLGDCVGQLLIIFASIFRPKA